MIIKLLFNYISNFTVKINKNVYIIFNCFPLNYLKFRVTFVYKTKSKYIEYANCDIFTENDIMKFIDKLVESINKKQSGYFNIGDYRRFNIWIPQIKTMKLDARYQETYYDNKKNKYTFNKNGEFTVYIDRKKLCNILLKIKKRIEHICLIYYKYMEDEIL